MLNIRVKNSADNSLLVKLQIEKNSNLLQLKNLIVNEVEGQFELQNLKLSLNKKDVLQNNQDEISLQQLGICSGDLIWIMFENENKTIQTPKQNKQNQTNDEDFKSQKILNTQNENHRQILNPPKRETSKEQNLLISNNIAENKQFASNNLINIFHEIMMEMFFIPENQINEKQVSQNYLEQRYILQHLENNKIYVDIKFVIFGNQWLIILGLVQDGWTFNYPVKFENGIYLNLNKCIQNFQDEEQKEEYQNVRYNLINNVIYPLVMKSCLKLDVIFPYSLSALPINVKNRILDYVSQGRTLGRLSCINKEFRALIIENENVWRTICESEIQNFTVNTASTYRQQYLQNVNEKMRRQQIRFHRVA
eukprot:TRINITY_DN20287_c0_g1_i4.p1 TRINITY_DN20287_c0_g1~~TRINITY_DN20287_c0_g1_i4.p1  ORF type:complete len:365 (+),score=43.79 TRINITY_DN20287_c0_g1_i4:85-1179(+)